MNVLKNLKTLRVVLLDCRGDKTSTCLSRRSGCRGEAPEPPRPGSSAWCWGSWGPSSPCWLWRPPGPLGWTLWRSIFCKHRLLTLRRPEMMIFFITFPGSCQYLVLLTVRVLYDGQQLRDVEENAGVLHDLLVLNKASQDWEGDWLIEPWWTAWRSFLGVGGQLSSWVSLSSIFCVSKSNLTINVSVSVHLYRERLVVFYELWL